MLTVRCYCSLSAAIAEPFHASHPVVLSFWRLLEQDYANGPTLPEEQRKAGEAGLRRLLLFWTGSEAVPSCGYFGSSIYVNPEPLTIGATYHGEPEPVVATSGSADVQATALPTVSTCSKLLRLPLSYTHLPTARAGLQRALDYGNVGFDLP